METTDANFIAVDGRTQAVARALKRLGMRQCSARLVQYQFKPRPTRPDWYGAFWRWFRAIWVAHRAGAEFLFEDFCAKVSALRDADLPHAQPPVTAQVEKCQYRNHRFVAAYIRGDGDDSLIREAVEGIVEMRALVRMLTARRAREVKVCHGKKQAA